MKRADQLSFRWNHADDIAPAAAFAGEIIGAAPSYISHGEIQVGLSDDGKNWVDDLAERYAADFAEQDGREMLVARDARSRIVALLIIAFEMSRRRKFAVIEDMVVDPALRGQGIGGELLTMAQERIQESNVDWVFLESGVRNEKAHQFFERAGFQLISHVFARKILG